MSALLAVQLVTLFVVIPMGAYPGPGRFLLDLCNLAFALVCVFALTGHRAVQGLLVLCLMVLASGRLVDETVVRWLGLGPTAVHDIIGFVAFAFNAVFTALVARHVFAPGRVTRHRIQGGVLLYLNIAALFAIAYGLLETHSPGAIAATTGTTMPVEPGALTATLQYFSLATITTTGYGDFAPVSPIARSLANLEAVVGQIYVATLLARLMGLHISLESSSDH